MEKVTNKAIYLEMKIPGEDRLAGRQAVMFPRRAESSLTSTNYHREMTGMFKVNKMEGVLLTKYKQFFLGGGGPLSKLIVFAIIHCLGNQQLFSGILSWKCSISSQWPCLFILARRLDN